MEPCRSDAWALHAISDLLVPSVPVLFGKVAATEWREPGSFRTEGSAVGNRTQHTAAELLMIQQMTGGTDKCCAEADQELHVGFMLT